MLNVIVEQLDFLVHQQIQGTKQAFTKWISMERMTYSPISTLYPNSTKVRHNHLSLLVTLR